MCFKNSPLLRQKSTKLKLLNLTSFYYVKKVPNINVFPFQMCFLLRQKSTKPTLVVHNLPITSKKYQILIYRNVLHYVKKVPNWRPPIYFSIATIFSIKNGFRSFIWTKMMYFRRLNAIRFFIFFLISAVNFSWNTPIASKKYRKNVFFDILKNFLLRLVGQLTR